MAALLAVATLAAPAAQAADAEEPLGCTDTATVSWSVDPVGVLVTGASVAVPGCGDGELVGLQLITDDGDVPENAPLVVEVEGERADFDLAPLEMRIEPVVGVRIFLLAAAVFEITVEQRFFNPAGREQHGLRKTTVLQVAEGDLYEVPGPPTRYREIECASVGLPAGGDVIGEGSGIFTATEGGRHRVCFRQIAGTSSAPPIIGTPVVLGQVVTQDSTEILATPAAAVGNGWNLASSGGVLASAVAMGAVLGWAALRLRRRRG